MLGFRARTPLEVMILTTTPRISMLTAPSLVPALISSLLQRHFTWPWCLQIPPHAQSFMLPQLPPWNSALTKPLPLPPPTLHSHLAHSDLLPTSFPSWPPSPLPHVGHKHLHLKTHTHHYIHNQQLLSVLFIPQNCDYLLIISLPRLDSKCIGHPPSLHSTCLLSTCHC